MDWIKRILLYLIFCFLAFIGIITASSIQQYYAGIIIFVIWGYATATLFLITKPE